MATELPTRVKQGLTVNVRYRTRARMTMNVLDVSLGGCLVESHGWTAKPGDKVHVTFPGLEGLAATVVWNEDRRAGIAFDEPLYGPVHESLKA